MSRVSTPKTPHSVEDVVELPLDVIDTEDDVYCARLDLNVDTLARDIEAKGQLIPIVVRRRGKRKYQIVCGFRRMGALVSNEAPTVKAIIRDLTDDEAYALSWAENEERKSYGVLDRINAVVKARAAGKSFEDLGTIFGLGRKQLARLQGLAEMEPAVGEALAAGRITTSHAVVLTDAKKRTKGLKTKFWLREIAEKTLSVSDLRKRLRERTRSDASGPFVVDDDKVRLRPISIDASRLSAEEKTELDALLGRLRELHEKSRSTSGDAEA
jgi:ParB/RepB/Spo0J family partition protein